MPMTEHPCGYPGCAKMVRESKLACIVHWFALPDNVRELCWRLFRQAELAGKVDRGSHRYIVVSAVARAHWAVQAGDDGERKSREEIETAKFHRRRALSKGEPDPFEGLALEDFFDDAEAFEAIPETFR